LNLEKSVGRLKGIEDIPESDLDNLKPESIKPLLVIELHDETAVPKVFYQGEEITNKVRVSFEWETRTDELGGTAYNIDYVEVVNKEPIHKGVGLARGKYGVALFDQ